jgi:uncharacterized protein (TIGR00725 family)
MLLLDEDRLRDEGGRLFDPHRREWLKAAGRAGGEPIEVPDAVRWLQADPARRCRVLVAVVGPREPTPAQIEAAEEVGRRIAGLGVVVLCGGRGGVMEAACRGVEAAGGTSVGLLPGDDPAEANSHVTIPIATGIGVARNALIARAALCLVAIGGGYGTISEVAYGLQFGKRVFGIAGAPDVRGVQHLEDAASVEVAVARAVLALPEA